MQLIFNIIESIKNIAGFILDSNSIEEANKIVENEDYFFCEEKNKYIVKLCMNSESIEVYRPKAHYKFSILVNSGPYNIYSLETLTDDEKMKILLFFTSEKCKEAILTCAKEKMIFFLKSRVSNKILCVLILKTNDPNTFINIST